MHINFTGSSHGHNFWPSVGILQSGWSSFEINLTNCPFWVYLEFQIHTALQSLTGKYRDIQGKPCNKNREPAMKTGFPCNESRYFPVGIDLQGFPVSCCKLYRVWICSVPAHLPDNLSNLNCPHGWAEQLPSSLNSTLSWAAPFKS